MIFKSHVQRSRSNYSSEPNVLSTILIPCLLALDRFCFYREDKPEFCTMVGIYVSETFLVLVNLVTNVLNTDWCKLYQQVLMINMKLVRPIGLLHRMRRDIFNDVRWWDRGNADWSCEVVDVNKPSKGKQILVDMFMQMLEGIWCLNIKFKINETMLNATDCT